MIHQLLPEMEPLYDCPQDPEWHPEGNVWIHTLMVIDKARELNGDLDRPRLATVMLGAVCHDLGKPATTAVIDGRVKSPNHEAMGVEPATQILDRLNINTLDGFDVRAQVLGLVTEHLRPMAFFKARDTVTDGAFRRLAQKVDLELLARFARADCHGRAGTFDCSGIDWFIERARSLGVEHKPPAPILLGRHLIELGVEPGPRMGEILRAVYELQLDGVVTTLDEARGARSLGSQTEGVSDPAAHARYCVTYFANASGATLPPLTTATTVPCRVAQPKPRGRGRHRAARLDHQPRIAEQPGHRLRDVVFADRDHFVDELLDVREGDVAGPQVHQAVGDARRRRQRDGLTGLERLRHLRRAERLDGDDAHRRLRLLDRRRRRLTPARRRRPARTRCRRRALLEDLEAHRALADDDLP